MRRSRSHRLPAILLLLPLLVGLLGAPVNTPTARGDELSDAKAQQQKLKDQVAAQKARVAALNSLQTALSSEINATKAQLSQIGGEPRQVDDIVGHHNGHQDNRTLTQR